MEEGLPIENDKTESPTTLNETIIARGRRPGAPPAHARRRRPSCSRGRRVARRRGREPRARARARRGRGTSNSTESVCEALYT